MYQNNTRIKKLPLELYFKSLEKWNAWHKKKCNVHISELLHKSNQQINSTREMIQEKLFKTIFVPQ